ncbi:MAG TPA: hypothetical protein VGO93_09345 [Candidatus Xenobia bacterium]|jgi:hypothetical protein
MQPISGAPLSPRPSFIQSDTPGDVPAVRYEALDPDLLKARYAANRPIIDAMLDSTTRPEEKADVERDLGILPTALLQAAQDRGVHIYITRPGEKGPPERLFHSNTDADVQTQRWDAWHANPSTDAPGAQVQMDKAQTWTDIAQAHGATTAEQVKAFETVAQHANPGAAGDNVYVPDLWFDGDLQLTGQAHDALQQLRQYYPNNDSQDGVFNAGFNVLLVNEKALPDPSPLGGHYRTVVHEFGHVAYDIIAGTPDGQQMETDLHQLDQADGHQEQALEQEIAQEPDKSPFISAYAMESEAEHYAEGFESYWTEARHDGVPERPWTANGATELQGREPALWTLIDHDMQLFAPKTQNPLR